MGGPSPAVAKAISTPSLVLAYWMRGSMTRPILRHEAEDQTRVQAGIVSSQPRSRIVATLRSRSAVTSSAPRSFARSRFPLAITGYTNRVNDAHVAKSRHLLL